MSYKLSVVIEKDGNGYYAFCPDLPGCQTQSRTLDEAMERIKEAAELYMETLSIEERLTIGSSEIVTANVEVSVG